VYTLDFKSPVYDALIPLLCEAPTTAAELARRPELAGLGEERIAQCLQNLSLGGQVVPMRALPVPATRAARYRMPSAFNRGALDEGIAGEGPLALASPAIGTGLQVSRADAAFLRVLTEGVGDAQDQDRRREAMGPKLCQLGVLDAIGAPS